MNLFNKKKQKQKIPSLTERLPLNNAIAIEAIVNVLEKKNILDKQELLQEVKKLAKVAKKSSIEKWSENTSGKS